MKFKFNVPFFNKDRNHLDLSHNHTLTHNFGVHNLLSVIDLSPGDEVTVDLSGFTRLMPLPCPSYGGVKMVHRAYVVNNEFALKHFSDFIAMQKVSKTASSLGMLKIPYFTPLSVIEYVCSSRDYTVDLGAESTSVRHDILYNSHAYRLTAKGRRLMSWLNQLDYVVSNFSQSLYNSRRFDVTALFAFWKYYLDWVVPARFVLMEPRFVYIKHVLEDYNFQDRQYKLVYKANGQFAADEIDISKFLMVPTAFLDDDYYTAAFVTPYGVENSSSVPVEIGESIDGLAYQGSDANNVGNSFYDPESANHPFVTPDENQMLTQFGLLSLGRLQDLVNAKKITSTKVLDYLRVSYGVAPSSDSLRLSQYLGSHESQIMIGDVMSTASTKVDNVNTYVGQYAGKGLGGSSAKWKFKSNFHGYMFITCELVVKSSYVNGSSPLRTRFEPLDWFNAKFDNVGVRAIEHQELISNSFEPVFSSQISNIPSPQGIFGFAPRYSEYKFKNDKISGDFMFPSVNAGLDSWYLSRKFNITDNPIIGLEFCSATSDSVGSQYDRIFQNTNNDDHFYSSYHIGIDVATDKESMFDYFKEIDSQNAKSTKVVEQAINN